MGIALIQFLLNRFLMSMSWLHHLPSANKLGSIHQPHSLRIEHHVSPPNISLRRTRDSAGLPAAAGRKLDQSQWTVIRGLAHPGHNQTAIQRDRIIHAGRRKQCGKLTSIDRSLVVT